MRSRGGRPAVVGGTRHALRIVAAVLRRRVTVTRVVARVESASSTGGSAVHTQWVVVVGVRTPRIAVIVTAAPPSSALIVKIGLSESRNAEALMVGRVFGLRDMEL